MKNVPLQLDLSPAYPNVFGNTDYNEFRDTLVKIDKILRTSGLEERLINEALEQWVIKHNKDEKFCNSKAISYHWKLFRYALRCNIYPSRMNFRQYKY